MSAIAATSRTCKTMADGTLRLTVDIEPKSAQDAFQMFGMPDMPIALVRLTQEAAIQSAQDETIADVKPKGGELAKWAGILCNDPLFKKFLDDSGVVISPREYICTMCGVDSRAELDHNKEGGLIFRKVMYTFSAWKEVAA